MSDLHGEYEESAAQHPGHIVAPVQVGGHSPVVPGVLSGVQHGEVLGQNTLLHDHHPPHYW